MKHLLLPTLAAFTLLCAGPLWADTTSNPSPTSSTTSAEDGPPATVVEVVNGELDLSRLGSADATVEVSYPEIADGQTVSISWEGGGSFSTGRVVGGGAKTLVVKIPNAVVVRSKGKIPELYYFVGTEIVSRPLHFRVVESTSNRTDPPPTVDKADGDVLDIGAFTGDLTVSVSYPEMADGQSVQLFWLGPRRFYPREEVRGCSTRLQFTVPRDVLENNVGLPVTLVYDVTDGSQTRSSKTVTLSVVDTQSKGKRPLK